MITDFQIFFNLLANAIRHGTTDSFNGQIKELNNQQLQQILAMHENGNNLLHIAIEQDRIDMVNALLQKGIDITTKNSEKLTALQMASKKGLTNIVELMIPYDDIGNYEIYGHYINSFEGLRLNPLILASNKNHYQTVELLINKNFYTNELHYFVLKTKKDRNFEECRELLEFLKAKGYNFKAKDSEGCNVLFCFTYRGIWNEDLFQFLVQDKELNLINESNNNGDTFLHASFQDNMFAIFNIKYQMLIDAGADPKITNHYGWTPLHCAIVLGGPGSEEQNELLPHFFDNEDDFNHIDFFKEALDNGADLSYFGNEHLYKVARITDMSWMKFLLVNKPYYFGPDKLSQSIEVWFKDPIPIILPECQMISFLINKGLHLGRLINKILCNDTLLNFLCENRQREFDENNNFLENSEFKVLNAPEEQILGIVNLLVSLGKGLNTADDDQETNDYNETFEKLKTHMGILNLEEIGYTLIQKIDQAQKETNPRNAHNNVLFFKRLNELCKELSEIMLNDGAENYTVYHSDDAREILDKIKPYIDINAVQQIAECASFSYLMRNATAHDLQQHSQDITITKSKILPWIDKATQGILGQVCKAPVLDLMNGLINLSIKKHATEESANKRPMIDREESGDDSMQNLQASSTIDEMERTTETTILGNDSSTENSGN